VRSSVPRILASSAIAAAIVGAFACASVLGVKELPLKTDAAELIPVTDAGADVDGSYCQTLFPAPDFCDDFDNEGPDFEHWNGGSAVPANQTNPILYGLDSDASIKEDERMHSPALLASVNNPDKQAGAAFIVQEVRAPEGRTPRGIRLLVKARFPTLAFDITDADRTDKFVIAFAVGGGFITEGIAVTLLERKTKGKFDITLQQRALESTLDPIELGNLFDLDNGTLASNAAAIELIIARDAALIDLKHPCHPTDNDSNPIDAAALPDVPPDGLRIYASMGGAASKCVLARNEFAKGEWLSKVALIAGTAVGAFGHAAVALDNVTMYFIW
jgi:hypothetical protein